MIGRAWTEVAGWAAIGVALVLAAGCRQRPAVVPLLAAHAHNDYEHARPLFDALDRGFCSVEADVWLVDGRLRVAHDRNDARAERTLEALYLEPLRERVRANGGRVYRGGPGITLLIDVKSEARATYAALEEVLARYPELFTRWESGTERPGPVTAILSGNRAAAEVKARALRRVALDGRSTDLEAPAPAALYPWISDNWSKLSAWRGTGDFPAADRAKLQDWVRQAHAGGRKLRFWNVPETPAAWRMLRAAGVDIIGTDRLDELAAFLRDAR
jgi:hypothetical protein